MHIIYLTWGETPRASGVYFSQVVSHISSYARVNSSCSVSLVAAVPAVHSGIFREKLGYFRELKKIRTFLGNIKFHWINVLTVQPLLLGGGLSWAVMFLSGLRGLARVIRVENPQVIHCRSYHATAAALYVRERFGFTYKVVFDARSPWPEAVALLKNWTVDDSKFRFLKQKERFLFENADLTLVVSGPMRDHFIRSGCSRLAEVPISSDLSPCNASSGAIRKESEKIMKFCYVGALTEGGWNDIEMLAELFEKLVATISHATLVIVTPSSKNDIMSRFKMFGDAVVVCETRSREDMAEIMSSCDFGVLSYSYPVDDARRTLAATVLSVKFVEYISVGLPVIVNVFCGGAAKFVEAHNCGLTYHPKRLGSISRQGLLDLATKSNRARIEELGREYFYVDSIVKRQNKLHLQLSGKVNT